MHDAIDTLQGPVGHRLVAHVANHQLHALGDLDLGVPVDLRLEAVEDHNLVSASLKHGDEMPADEARAPGDKCPHVCPIVR